MVTVRVRVISEAGLGAVPATLLVKSANGFRSGIQIRKTDQRQTSADAKCVSDVLALCVNEGEQIELICQGDDEREAAAMLKQLLDTNFAGLPRPVR